MIILSLFDFSGGWSAPYERAGYTVIRLDIKAGIDIMTWDYKQIERGQVVGILAAPPCTHFTVSGAQYWNAKDQDGRTAENVALVYRTLEIVEHFQPTFWALENPIGRISTLVPELKGKRLLDFDPCDFGDPYTKRTVLYGHFSPFLVRCPVKPKRTSSQGSWLQNLGGKSERTKELRSLTPAGFANAFFQANNPKNLQCQPEPA